MALDEVQNNPEVYARILQLLQEGQYAEAERLCNLALKVSATSSHLPWFYLGAARQFLGKVPSALEAFQKARTIAPDDTEVVNACASCLSQLGRHEEAYEETLFAHQLTPESAVTCANLGVALERLGKLDEALPYYDKALLADTKNEVALTNRGAILSKLNRRLEGLQHNREAHALRPELFSLLYNLVDSLIGLFQYDEALAHCDAGLAWMPRHAHMMFKKGMILSCMARFEEAQKYLSMAQIIAPGILEDLLPNLRKSGTGSTVHADARLLYFDAMYQQQLCCFWRDRGRYMRTLNDVIQSPEVPFALVHGAEFGFQSFSLEIDASTRFKLAKNIGNYVRDTAWLMGLPPFKFASHRRTRLKIAYISADFRRHPTGYLSRQIYGLHDRDKFEVFVYSLIDVDASDSIYQHIKSTCDTFREVASLNTYELTKLIHEDGIDILIDLAGYTRSARPDVIALRPAPVHVSYIGYVESMGNELVDYAITDVNVYPESNKSFWHEQPIRMPHHVLPYDDKVDNAPVDFKRSDYGLPEDGFVFCSFNNSYKIEPEIFSTWMNILKAVPNSVLWLINKNEQAQWNLRDEAMIRGIDAKRLVFAPYLDIASHCLRYQMADLFLDTLWHNAHTTALEALWQGLPLLTREGKVVSARLAASCLYNLGLPELITHTTAEYEEKAIYYAQHPAELKALREKLASARYSSPLFNTALHVKHLESAYELVWKRYEAGLPPAPIDVPEIKIEDTASTEKVMH